MNEPMKIVRVSAIPMSAPVPREKRHRTDLGTKIKSDATLIRVELDNGLIAVSDITWTGWHKFRELRVTIAGKYLRISEPSQ